MNFQTTDKLPCPDEMRSILTPTKAALTTKATRDTKIAALLGDCPTHLGTVPGLLLIVGPCSAHCPDAVLEYTHLLAETAKEVADKILIIPRVYTAKPRSASMGYMGILHQPDGLFLARKMHLDILEQTGLSTADEMLYPALTPYFDDLVSYFAVGARSVQNQEHRLVASGLTAPVGMKNPISGELSDMEAAVRAAKSPHSFIFRDQFVQTSGNPLAHGVLRGIHNRPNFTEAKNTTLPYVLVDASHGNSRKEPKNQRNVALEAIKIPKVKGIMIESFTHKNQSITDPCLPWQDTRHLIHELYSSLD